MHVHVGMENKRKRVKGDAYSIKTGNDRPSARPPGSIMK